MSKQDIEREQQFDKFCLEQTEVLIISTVFNA